MRFTPLMGSLGRRDGDSLGKKVFLRIPFIKTALKSPRGRPSGAATFIVFSGMRASAFIFVILSIHALLTKNSDEPNFTTSFYNPPRNLLMWGR
jgi:hypothetical protein